MMFLRVLCLRFVQLASLIRSGNVLLNSCLCQSLCGWLAGLSTVGLNELDHLGDRLCGQNGKQICNQEELELLGTHRLSWLKLAQGNALAVVGATATSVDKGRVETVHVEVLIVDEETFAYCRVTVIERVHIEPKGIRDSLVR